jgi:ribonuclease G
LLIELEKKLQGRLSFRADPTFHFEQFKITDAISGNDLG